MPNKSIVQKKDLERILQAYSLIVEGASEEDAAEEMGLSLEEFDSLKSSMLRHKARQAKKRTPEMIFAQYELEQAKNLRRLEAVCAAPITKDSSIVAAIRLKSEIQLRVIDLGKDLGLLRDAKPVMAAGVDISEMSVPELQKAIQGIVSEFETLRSAFGGGGNILELTPGALYPIDQEAEPDVVISTEGIDVTEGVSRKRRKKKKKRRGRDD